VFNEQVGGSGEELAEDFPAANEADIGEDTATGPTTEQMMRRVHEIKMTTGIQAPVREHFDNKLDVIVRDQYGGELAFRIKRTTALRKVMDTYCREHNLVKKGRRTVRFLYDGEGVQNDNTPQSVSTRTFCR
jgi:Ubiquitin-2 like Rad60 SUMO-like